MDPVRELEESLKYVSSISVPISLGIDLIRELESRSNYLSVVNTPISQTIDRYPLCPLQILSKLKVEQRLPIITSNEFWHCAWRNTRLSISISLMTFRLMFDDSYIIQR
jgi:hypothetical protein